MTEKMTNEYLMNRLVDIHNNLVKIQVRGDDVLLMADAIRGLRIVVQNLLEPDNQEQDQEE